MVCKLRSNFSLFSLLVWHTVILPQDQEQRWGEQLTGSDWLLPHKVQLTRGVHGSHALPSSFLSFLTLLLHFAYSLSLLVAGVAHNGWPTEVWRVWYALGCARLCGPVCLVRMNSKPLGSFKHKPTLCVPARLSAAFCAPASNTVHCCGFSVPAKAVDLLLSLLCFVLKGWGKSS